MSDARDPLDELAAAIGMPITAAELLCEAMRAAQDAGVPPEQVWTRIRVNTNDFLVLFEVGEGLFAGLEVQLYGSAALKVHHLGDLGSDRVFDYCERRHALRAGCALALAGEGEPSGWCRASRLCDSRPEVRPHTCERGPQCRWHGWREERNEA